MKTLSILAPLIAALLLAGCEATGLEIDATPQAFTPGAGATTTERTWDGEKPVEKRVENPPAFK